MIQQLFNETVRVAIRPIVLGERTVSNNSMDAACCGDNFGRLHLVFDKQ
jgi:hypothetical protein